MTSVSIKELLEHGVHFGHQSRRWNPKMKEYIFETRNRVHIIDLRKTKKLLERALDFIQGTVAEGKDVIFVATKRQCREIVKETAEKLGQYYVIERWLGGTLTNFRTILSSVERLEELEAIRREGKAEGRSKKEIAALRREENRLHRNLDGIRNMKEPPGAVVVIDIMREANCLREANRLGVPVVALIDTNCDPEMVDYLIPCNDDGIKSTRLIITKIGEAVAAGLARRAPAPEPGAKPPKKEKAAAAEPEEKGTPSAAEAPPAPAEETPAPPAAEEPPAPAVGDEAAAADDEGGDSGEEIIKEGKK